MAIYRIFPEYDTFIYSESPTANAGKDEILELGGYLDSSYTNRTSRILIRFSDEEISNIIENKIGNNNWESFLNLYLAEASEIPKEFEIKVYPISQQYSNGVGKFGDFPENRTGVSWKYRLEESTGPWKTTGFITNETGSSIMTQPGGGSWFTGSNGISLEASQSFTLNSELDLHVNVSNFVSMSYNGDVTNNGLIVKLDNETEFFTTSSVRLRYFSSDTNTIYPPFLEFKWDDSNYQTGSLNVLNNSQATVVVKNNKGEYPDEGKYRFRIHAKPTYPVRVFTTSSVYLTNYALPQNTYWGLRDEHSEEMIVDFDNSYTKVSCDSTGPYFDVYMEGLQPERYYRILLKSELDGSTTVVDNDNVFKVVRNG